MEKLEKQCQEGSAEMLQLAAQVARSKKEIASYTDLLIQLDQSSSQLKSSLQEFLSLDHQAFRVLYNIQEQIEGARANFDEFRHKKHRLEVWLANNPDIVGAARVRLMLDHVHVSRRRFRLYLCKSF